VIVKLLFEKFEQGWTVLVMTFCSRDVMNSLRPLIARDGMSLECETFVGMVDLRENINGG